MLGNWGNFMAHKQQLKFIEIVNKYFLNKNRKSDAKFKILEIGSFDVNGSTRTFLQDSNTQYIGVDLCEGKGVDIVSFGHTLDQPANSFDFVMSCECFEHDPHWIDTFKNMYRMTKPGSILAFTCATLGRLEHGTVRTSAEESPGTQFIGLDYYKNLTKEDFQKSMDLTGFFDEHFFFYERTSRDLYFVGQKKGGLKIDFDRELFFAEVSEINKIAKFRPNLITVPVDVARLFLPEQQFQDFSVVYLKKVRPVRKFFRSLTRKAA
jgi:SAM-dependent methyltransferase